MVSLWTDGTAVILGGGPSLTHDQAELVRRAREAGAVRVIAVNNSYTLDPGADICYFADSSWWNFHKDKSDFAAFAGQKCSIQLSGGNITDDSVHMLRNRDFPNHGVGLSLDPRALVTGRNGGFQALNLAILAGATTVILLGIDGRPNSNGKTHWHGGHHRPTAAAAYEEYRKAFSAAEDAITAAGVRVVNASPGSYVDSFEKVELEVVL